MIHFNAASWANAAVVVALFCMSCSSTNATKARERDDLRRGGRATTFSLQTAGIEGLMTISK
jgi:hypothetical protein